MIHLQLVPPAHLEAVWAIVKPGIEKCNSRMGVFGSELEVVRQQLDSNYVGLFLIMEDSQYKGFFTSSAMYLGKENTLLIGMFYSRLGHRQLNKVVPPLKMLAKELGCSRISTFNPFLGFQRIAPELGLQPRVIEYTMEA